MNKNVKIIMAVVILILLLGGIYAAFRYASYARNSDQNYQSSEFNSNLITQINLPEDFPDLENSAVESHWENNTEEIYVVSYVLISSKEIGEVFDYYSNNLEHSGWIIKSLDEDTRTIAFEKEDKYGFLVVTQKNDAETYVSITIAQKEK